MSPPCNPTSIQRFDAGGHSGRVKRAGQGNLSRPQRFHAGKALTFAARRATLPVPGVLPGWLEGWDVQKFPMTAEGLARLQDELRVLKSDERPAVIRAIAEAREHGDLSENAEYHAARERQSFIEGRIAELESIIPSAEVIDPSKLSGSQVRFGAHVTVVDEESEGEKTYRIVGQYEADMKNGSISISSPLAKALIGKTVGDSVEVPAPGGARVVEIAAVRFV